MMVGAKAPAFFKFLLGRRGLADGQSADGQSRLKGLGQKLQNIIMYSYLIT